MEKTIKATFMSYDYHGHEGRIFSKEALEKMVEAWKLNAKDNPSYGELNHPETGIDLIVDDIELADDGVEISYREIPKEQQKCDKDEITKRWDALGFTSGLTIQINEKLKPLFESFSWTKLDNTAGETELPDKENVPE